MLGLHADQGSAVWKLARNPAAGIVSASRLAAFLGFDPHVTSVACRRSLFLEEFRTFEELLRDDTPSYAAARGRRLEPYAVEFFHREFFGPLERDDWLRCGENRPGTVLHPSWPLSASPDEIFFHATDLARAPLGLEIKTTLARQAPSPASVPLPAWLQCQAAMAVFGLEEWMLCYYFDKPWAHAKFFQVVRSDPVQQLIERELQEDRRREPNATYHAATDSLLHSERTRTTLLAGRQPAP